MAPNVEQFVCSFDPENRSFFAQELEEEADGEIVTLLESGVALCTWKKPARLFFCRHRFAVEQVIPIQDLSSESTFEELRALTPAFGLNSLQSPHSIQIRAAARLAGSFGELSSSWRSAWGLNEELWSPRTPDSIFSAYLSQSHGYFGVSLVGENISSWSGGACRIPRDPESVSRAESKLLEALELLPESVGRGDGKKALDLGAAPGGWSRVVANCGYEVDAVDPADLDPKVEPLVSHYATTAGDFLSEPQGPYELLMSDMKMEPNLAAQLLCECATVLKPDGYLVATLKLPKKGHRLEVAREAVQELAKIYTVIQARQLYFNRNEVTVMAQKS